MEHAYLTRRDIDIARSLKQITKLEVKELLKKIEICSQPKQVGNIIIHPIY